MDQVNSKLAAEGLGRRVHAHWRGDRDRQSFRHASILPVAETAILTAPLAANDVRRDFLRARLVIEAGRPTVTPVRSQDSSLLSMLAEANALIVRKEFATAAASGDAVEIIRL